VIRSNNCSVARPPQRRRYDKWIPNNNDDNDEEEDASFCASWGRRFLGSHFLSGRLIIMDFFAERKVGEIFASLTPTIEPVAV
jgi:hypothetical protein